MQMSKVFKKSFYSPLHVPECLQKLKLSEIQIQSYVGRLTPGVCSLGAMLKVQRVMSNAKRECEHYCEHHTAFNHAV